MRLSAVILLGAFVVMGACGKKDEDKDKEDDDVEIPAAAGGCAVTLKPDDAKVTCVEFPTAVMGEAYCNAVKEGNDQANAEWSTSACGAADLVGYCVVTEDNETARAAATYYYYTPSFTAESAESSCTDSEGTFGGA